MTAPLRAESRTTGAVASPEVAVGAGSLDPAAAERNAASPDGKARSAADGPARSSLRRAGRPEIGLPRPVAARSLLVFAGLAAAALLSASIVGRWFDPASPGRLLYWLHDSLWLPLYGRLWLAPFPGGLVWAVPAGLIALLVAIEFLGLGQPIRRAQLRLLDLFLAQGLGEVLLRADRGLRRMGLRAGLAAALVDERLSETCAAALERLGEPDSLPVGLVPLARLKVLLDVDAAGPRERLLLAELLAMAELSGPESLRRAHALVPLLHQIDGRGPAPIAPSKVMGEGVWPGDPMASAEALAARTLDVVLGIAQHRRPEALAWFDAWARTWADPDTPAPARKALAGAEALIAFEAWAALAEARAAGADTPGLLAEAFAETRAPRPRGELFARHGTETVTDEAVQ